MDKKSELLIKKFLPMKNLLLSLQQFLRFVASIMLMRNNLRGGTTADLTWVLMDGVTMTHLDVPRL